MNQASKLRFFNKQREAAVHAAIIVASTCHFGLMTFVFTLTSQRLDQSLLS